MSVHIRFFGAAGTVTGSKFIVQSSTHSLLVDAGMFQGPREWREKNWEKLPFNPAELDAVLLTHAHIDHTGILPRLSAEGLRAPVFSTKPTHDLCKILLPDSAKLHEEEALYRRKHKASRHQDPKPLYTEEDAQAALKLFKNVRFGRTEEILPGVSVNFNRMGHILGAASISLEIEGKRLSFSGDIGRYSVPILSDPEPIEFGDCLLIESTYGDREHGNESPKDVLAKVINAAYKRGGALLVPSFAVGRTQLLLYYIRELKEEGIIPDLPVIIDSPMADDATRIYRENPGCYDDDALAVLEDQGISPFAPTKLHFVQSRDESMKLNGIREPMILISASGMLTGGRVLHHLKHRISDPRTTVLFVGYQPPGGRGDWIQSGAESLRIFGEDTKIAAHIETLSGLSAHGDRQEMLRWCKESTGTPGRVAIVHGEKSAADEFQRSLQEELQWNAFVPEYGEELEV